MTSAIPSTQVSQTVQGKVPLQEAALPPKGELSLPPQDSRERVKAFMTQLQDEICRGLEQVDGGAKFQQDAWAREEGGGGRSRVIQNGAVLEKGGVNFSEVWGKTLPPSILNQCPEAAGHDFLRRAPRWCYTRKIPMCRRYTSTIATLRRARCGGLGAALT